jgi:hypothetical protein
MSIIVNNGVQNILGTPGAISGVFADRPSATGVADGTLYFSTDTTAIYQAVSGAWILYTGGGGGGSVNSVTGTAPIASSGGANPVISISQADIETDGYLSSIDWNTFNNKIGGSGIATRVAFWSATNEVTSSANLYWDNINNFLGVKTITPAYNLDVNGTGRFTSLLKADTDILVNNYFQINTTSNTIPAVNGIYRHKVNGAFTYLLEDEQGYAQHKWSLIQRFGYNLLRDWYLDDSSILNINLGWGNTNTSNLNGASLLINTPINVNSALYTNLTIRGIYYNPQVINLVNTTHIAFENTSGDIIFGNLASGTFPITYVDNDGKLGNSTLINDSFSETLYSVSNGDSKGFFLDYGSNTFKFGSYDFGNGTTLLISDNFSVAYFLNVANGSAGAQGMYMDFANNRYVFGDVSNTTNGINIELNNSDRQIFATFGNVQNGLFLNFDLLDFYLGDVDTFSSFVNVNVTEGKIFFKTPNGKYNFQNVPRYDNNADALADGLIVGDIYRTPDTLGTSNILKIVV